MTWGRPNSGEYVVGDTADTVDGGTNSVCQRQQPLYDELPEDGE